MKTVKRVLAPRAVAPLAATCLDRHKKGRTPDTHALGLDPHYIMV